MGALIEASCSRCGRANEALAPACALCGELLRRETDEAPSVAPRTVARAAGSASLESLRAMIPEARVEARGASRATSGGAHAVARAAREHRTNAPADESRTAWLYLASGLATAPIFAWTPILQYMGWFLASLVHEMGHSLLAWVCGMPAMPAISLAGEAAAMHSDQMPFLVAMIVVGVVAAIWRTLERRARWIALAGFGVLYPALAFTDAKELLHLLAGHGAELAFATLCLWKTLDGGFTESRAERALYGTVGWYLLGKNAFLCFGLMFRAQARTEYASNGSFGLTNDYIRAAEEVLGWRLESVACLMLVACALVLPAAIALWRWPERSPLRRARSHR